MPTGWFVVQPPSSGILRNNRQPISVEMSGQQLTDGSIAPIELEKVSVAMSGQVPLHGPMNIELKKLAFAMSGEEKTFGGLAITLPKVALNFEQELNQGQMFMTMKPVKLAFALQTQGQIAATLATVDTLLSSTQEITGALAARLQYARHILAGAHQQDGVLTSALKTVAPAIVAEAPNPVTLNSASTGAFHTSSALTSKTVVWDHEVVEGDDRKMYIGVWIGHNNWTNPTGPTVVSSIDGSATLVTRVDYGNDSGYRLGHVCLFELDNPTVGTHTFTANTTASQSMNLLDAVSRCYDHAASIDTPTTQAQTSTNGVLNLSVTPGDGDMALLLGSCNSAGSTVITAPTETPWHQIALTINGDVDYRIAFDVPGTGAAVPFTSSNSNKFGAIATVIRKVT